MPPLPRLFILDHDTSFVFEDYRAGNYFVLSEEEWKQFNKSTLDQYSAIVLLAELDWKGKNISEDFGFTIGLDLRRKYKCLLPIIITSSMIPRFFELRAAKELRYNLLFARGTSFLPLMEASEQIISLLVRAEPITLPLLTDMNEMLFNLRGVLSDTLGHRLQSDLSLIAYQDLMGEMKAMLNTQDLSALNWEKHQELLQDALGNQDIFYALKSEFLRLINITLFAVHSLESVKATERRHRLLVVEDDDQFAKKILSNLSGYFSEIIYTDDAAKAIEIIRNDSANSIVGLLCDWRLYADSSKKYWQIQGYEILNYAARHRFAALFGITSLSDTNVHNIRNMLGFEMHLFKKEHFVGADDNTQWKIIADIILQKCDAITQLIAAEPSGTSWLKLKELYIAKRNSSWQAYEYEISSEAERIYLFYKKAIEDENTRNVFSISEMGLSLKNNLTHILIMRRVYMGIYFMLNQKNIYLQEIHPVSFLGIGEKVDTGLRHHSIDAYSILRKDWWNDIQAGESSLQLQEEWEKFDQRIKNFRNALCIDIGDLPRKGILPEEQAWMTQNSVDFSFFFNYWVDDFS